MDDPNEQFDGIESSSKRKERVLVVLGGAGAHTIAAMLGAELARRSREARAENVAFVIDLAAPIPEIIISEAVIEPEPLMLPVMSVPREWTEELTALEALLAKPQASWKDDPLESQVSPYGPPVRTASALRTFAKKGRK